MVNERFLIGLFRASFPPDCYLSFRENQLCEVLFALKVPGFLIEDRLHELQKTDHFPLGLCKKCHYYFNYCCYRRQTMIRNWTCIFCRVMKSGLRLDWMCLSCDNLICSGYFHSRKLFLLSCNKSPSCSHQLLPLFTAFSCLTKNHPFD